MSLGKIVSRGLWLHVNQIVLSVLGFIYWLVISALAGSETVGIATSVLGLASILSSAVNVGVPESIKRYIGKALGEEDERSLREFFWSGFSYMSFSLMGASAIIFLLSLTHQSIYGLKPPMLMYTSLLILFSFSGFLVGFITACLETQYITYSSIISYLSRLGVGVVLVMWGFQWVGATLGLIVGSAVNLLMLLYFSSRLINKYKVGLKPVALPSAMLELIKAGVVSWAPTFLLILGQWMGLLSIHEMYGGIASGHYYVAFAIYSVILSFPTTFIMLMLPVLSGMRDGRKRALIRVTRISLVLAGVLSPILYYYSRIPLSLIGKDYEIAHQVLSLLSLNLVPMILVTAVSILTYASGFYAMVLILGLATNVPRIFLYPSLVSTQGSLGAATSYLLGTLLGFSVALIISARINFKIPLVEVILVMLISYPIFYISSLLPMPWIVSVLLATALVIIIYIKLRLLTLKDIKEITLSLIPDEYVRRFYPLAQPFIKALFGEIES